MSKRIVVASTGASGALYLSRFLHYLGDAGAEVHLVLSGYAKQVIHEEIGALDLPAKTYEYSNKTMSAPFASGSTQFDAMVIIPCSMGTVGRIAAGTSETLILRTADVFLKERRSLILVPRETPWNLIHAKNIVSVMEAGAHVLPAMPSFYSHPETIDQLVDTVVWRVLDQIGLPAANACRWNE